MRVIGDKKPPEFTVEFQPKFPERVLVRFYENISEYKNKKYSGWAYDEYHLEIENRPGINTYITQNYSQLISKAMGETVKFEELKAQLDYISMMTGIDIPKEEGTSDE